MSGEHGDRVAVQGVRVGALGGVVDPCLGGDVGGVGVAAARHADVERGRPGAGGDDGVGGVHGAALRGVHRGGVAQRQVLRDVGWRKQQALAEHVAVSGAALDDGDLECAVGADGLDAVVLAVDRVAAVAFVAGDGPVFGAAAATTDFDLYMTERLPRLELAPAARQIVVA